MDAGWKIISKLAEPKIFCLNGLLEGKLILFIVCNEKCYYTVNWTEIWFLVSFPLCCVLLIAELYLEVHYLRSYMLILSIFFSPVPGEPYPVENDIPSSPTPVPEPSSFDSFSGMALYLCDVV